MAEIIRVALPIRNRLCEIIDRSFELLCQQCVGGAIMFDNEASMQVHLSDILLRIGKMYEFEPQCRFSIQLEKLTTISKTAKSGKGNARADVWLKMLTDSETAEAAIELKYLNYSKHAAVTDERYSILKDLENLEGYAAKNTGLIIREIVYSDNANHLKPKRGVNFPIADGCVIPTYLEKHSKTYKPITLRNAYPIDWQRFQDASGKNHFFLMLSK